LVKAVIDSHKGSIVLESEPGQGTTFFVRLPVLAEGDK
jgi:signal transduction histidine kinase